MKTKLKTILLFITLLSVTPITLSAQTNCQNDTIAPVAYCLPGVSTIPFSFNGYLDVYARDFDLGSSDNCTADSLLRFAFSEDPIDSVRRFTCWDSIFMDQQVVQLTIYVIDEADNYSTCQVAILTTWDCWRDRVASISGDLKTEDGKVIPEALVSLSGQVEEETISNIYGFYDFVQLNAYGNYTITPEKDDNYLNGVSTYDLVLMSKHILGIEPLTSPYKMIAADVNRSGTITAFDILSLRKLLLSIDETFKNNTSWRFVPTGFEFQRPNPFASAIPEVYEIVDLQSDRQANFIGVKIGDLNGSVGPSQLIESEERGYDGTCVLKMADPIFQEGEIVEVVVEASGFEEVIGFQYGLRFDPAALEYLELKTEQAGLDVANFGLTKMDQGLLLCSWNGSEVMTAEPSSIHYRLRFRAKAEGRLSDFVQLETAPLLAEAYTSDGGLLRVALQVETTMDGIWLWQNTPNPFATETEIAFELPKAMRAKLVITDFGGRVVWEREGAFSAGRQQWIVDGIDLSGGGVYFYSLQTAEQSSTKKMFYRR